MIRLFPWTSQRRHQASEEEFALEGKAAHPLMSEIRTLTVMFSLPMRPSDKLVPHFLVQLARFLLHHHRLALNNVRQNQAKIRLNAVVRPRSDASRWLSTKISANGQNVLVQARLQQPLHLQPQPHLRRHQHPPNQCASWIET